MTESVFAHDLYILYLLQKYWDKIN